MLGKLMKYEFMAMGRVFLPLFGALIVISVVNSILGSFGLETPAGIGIAVSVLLIISIAVITFLLIIQRFWTNLLSNEGYLMMTLPVNTDRIILSKLLTAAILGAASTIVVLLSILIMTITRFDFAEILEMIKYAFGLITFDTPQISTIVIQFLIATVLSMFTNILLFYACMSLSMLSNRYRWLVAVGSYIAIITVLQIVFAVAIATGVVSGTFGRFMLNYPTFGQIQLIIAAVMLLCVVLGVIFYFITRYMLKNRLNLQ